MKIRLIWVYTTVALAGGWAAGAGRAATRPARDAKVVLLLARAAKQEVSSYTLEQLTEMWPAFRHEPFETAGFNHFTLPFRYHSAKRTGDPNEAYAFSFLLSETLDLTPGCYCTRHAYFAFKRARRYMVKLARVYDKDMIRFGVNDWQATHAVGGLLRQSKKGYGGDLEIFDQTGRRVLHRVYKKPREYFELLGNMCVDSMRFFGYKAPPALAEHLRDKRCEHHQSIIDLGKAAFARERSEKEFGLYRRILQRDPGFADVRHWYENQRYWANYGRTKKADLVPPAPKCPEGAKYANWRKLSVKLLGQDRPDSMEARLKAAYQERRISPKLRARGTQLAAKYPNQHWMLYYLARTYDEGGRLGGDCDMAASIRLAAAQNRYLTGLGHKHGVLRGLAYSMHNLGRNDIAAQVLLPIRRREMASGGARQAAWDSRFLAWSLSRMGRYAEAVRYYRDAFKGSKEGSPIRNRMLAEAGIAAALAGRADILGQILRDRRKEAEQVKMLQLLEAYRNALAGKPVAIQQVRPKGELNGWWGGRQKILFCGQMELLSGQNALRENLIAWLRANPNDRPLWILFDAYDRQDPKPESACFYEALEWLHADDPWAREAVAKWRKRAPRLEKKAGLGPNELLERLKSFEAARWPEAHPSAHELAKRVSRTLPPGSVAATVRRLIAEGKLDAADELARKYLNVSVNMRSFPMRSHGNHLIHLVQQARAKKAPARPKDKRQW